MRISIMAFVRLLPLIILAALSGCSSKHAVSGKVVFDDGTPFVNTGMVIFEKTEDGVSVMARGDIQTDGTFKLSTSKPGDGVPAGIYRVCVAPRSDIVARSPGQPTGPDFDPKYCQFDTSTLTFEVKSGSNVYEIKVGKPIQKGARDPNL